MKEWLKKEWFKVGWLIIGTAFVIACFMASQNGRYQYHGDTIYSRILDTKEGTVYSFNYENKDLVRWDYPSAKITISKYTTEQR